MVLETVDLTKEYGNKKVVMGFNIDFTSGIWGLLGPNGAGKTTLMKMLIGITEPSKGRVLFDGNPIGKLGAGYREIIGYLPQKFGYQAELSVQDYLLYMAALKGIPKKKALEQIEILLSKVTLTNENKSKIRNLSGGMRQRVGIVQAMLNNPRVLILDEPTAGLDIEERRKFREYITEFSKDRIVIISTHIVSDIEFISNNISIMNEGQLLGFGDTRDLVKGVEGKVWETSIPYDDFVKIKDEIQLINYHNEDQNQIYIKYMADKPILENSISVNAQLDDYYLYLNRKLEVR